MEAYQRCTAILFCESLISIEMTRGAIHIIDGECFQYEERTHDIYFKLKIREKIRIPKYNV